MYRKLKELNIGGTFKSNLCDFVVIEKRENETVLVATYDTFNNIKCNFNATSRTENIYASSDLRKYIENKIYEKFVEQFGKNIIPYKSDDDMLYLIRSISLSEYSIFRNKCCKAFSSDFWLASKYNSDEKTVMYVEASGSVKNTKHYGEKKGLILVCALDGNIEVDEDPKVKEKIVSIETDIGYESHMREISYERLGVIQ